MSPVELLRSATLTGSAPYADASRAGDLVLTAGACPLDAHGALVEVDAIAVRPS